MRSIIAVAAAVGFSAMTAAALPAHADWKCDGPAYVCGSPSAETVKRPRVSYKSSKSKYAYKSSRRHYADAPARKRRSYGSSSYAYGGASGGIASYYWQGSRTASGARFNPDGLTAAHRTLPFGTRVRVTNNANGQSVIVTINDRGPFVGGRVIDLSRGAARAINMTGAGLARVSLEVLGRG